MPEQEGDVVFHQNGCLALLTTIHTTKLSFETPSPSVRIEAHPGGGGGAFIQGVIKEERNPTHKSPPSNIPGIKEQPYKWEGSDYLGGKIGV